ncbi:MAG: hypothetical protein LEGION0403_FIIPPAGN_00421 [Legionella sp.]|uniref:hypothetical protein n=1 Tax=Legionella sp. TaxID=459 RepID=UPI003D121272
MNEEKQVYLLHAILEDAKQALGTEEDKQVYELISNCQASLEHGNLLSQARKNVNKLIALLEQREDGQSTLDHLKKNGVYRILYRNPTILGQQAPQDDDLNQLLRAGFTGRPFCSNHPYWRCSILAYRYFCGAIYRCINLFKWDFIWSG